MSKYDEYWLKRLDVVAELLAEAAQKGVSRALDVSDMRPLGKRQAWYGAALLSADGPTSPTKTVLVHAMSLCRTAFDNGLMKPYQGMMFRLSISNGLQLTVKQEGVLKQLAPLPEPPQPAAVEKQPVVVTATADLPSVPAVYAMYGGRGRGLYVAYVGVGDNFRRRIEQHLVRRDSSVTTGTSAAMLNPDYVTEARWWEHPDFAERDKLEAAELVAFNVLQPCLRSRGGTRQTSAQLYATPEFTERMHALLTGEPAGRLVIPTLEDALERIAALEQRIAELEKRLP